MNPQNERRALAFIRTVANRCERCLHRSEERCRNCLAHWANSILRDIEAESNTIDYSLGARMLRILSVLDESDRPLKSSEINLTGLCSRQLKRWTLRKMLTRGMVTREATTDAKGRMVYVYASVDNDAQGTATTK